MSRSRNVWCCDTFGSKLVGTKMATALSASDYIWEGPWVNWSRGRVLGLTLTLDPYKASIVSPALAIFVSIAGTQLWNLFQFALHQTRATSSPQSLLYHQQQTILRNTGSDLNALWRLVRVALAWRHQRDAKVLRVSTPLILWAFLHFALIVLAGLFSSWLLETSDPRVLSRSPWCGTFKTTYASDVYSTDSENFNLVKLAMEYATYVDSRYANVQQHVDLCETGSDACDTFPTKDLVGLAPASTLLKGGCPFGDHVCHPDIDGSIFFDTGYLSSDSKFGFNAPKKDRVSFRMVAECAPLNDAEYSTGWQNVPSTDSNAPNSKVADALYGPSFTNSRNATYSLVQPVLECDQRAITQPYSLNAEFFQPGGNMTEATATFDPKPELQLPEADVSLVMLSSISSYLGPVNDPWFLARQKINDTNAFCMQKDKTLYIRDRPLTTIGCAQQWQVCNSASDAPNRDQCTPLLAWQQVQNSLLSDPHIKFSALQLATAMRILWAASGSTFYWAISALAQSAAPPLKARELMSATIALPVPDNQWQEETKYWWQIMLTHLQQISLDYGTGQFAYSTDYINVTKPTSGPSGEAAYDLCQNQMIRMKSWRNYNLFAMIITIVIATLIIILGLCIEDIVGYIRQRKLRYSGMNGKQDMWVANSDLEMLKTIDEAMHGTPWTRSRSGIPVTNLKGHHISIGDLRKETITVEDNIGVVNVAVKKQRTESISQNPWSIFPSEFGLDSQRAPDQSLDDTHNTTPTRQTGYIC